ncbi:MAG TPA: beta-ketoacyl-ACP synthase [Caulobacterales bacterium]|nr:beta-ketoacyl-ACP synthase [Caulobacterales bacterium]
MMGRASHILAFSVACALGDDNAAVAANLFAAKPGAIADEAELSDRRRVPVGRVRARLEKPHGETRTNRMVAHCFEPLARDIAAARARFGAARLGVVLGTCTSGIGEGGDAVATKLETGAWPEGFSLQQQQLGDAARFAAHMAGAEGPAYAVSTACTSGARALAAGARLIETDVCDAVLCGAADSLCALTLNGFASLDSLSDAPCNPMSLNRKGLNIGEGAALFLLTRGEGPFRLLGWGESADGHHISAPDPTGAGAERAIRKALTMSERDARAIDFVHLHGTATKLNDQMEAAVVHRVFGEDTPCASTKPLTGHTLGAAGAVQAALCLMALERDQLPPHLWDGVRDPELPAIRLAAPGERAPLTAILSASYAFGGNNAALVLAKT